MYYRSATFGSCATLLALALGACSNEPQSPRLAVCDPLAAHEQAIALGIVLVAGRDEAGTYFVVDRGPGERSEERVFVSSGATLQRKRVLGSGSNGMTDFTWSFEDGSTERRLVAQRHGDLTTGIALASPGARTFLDDLGADAEPLTPVDSSALPAFEIRNLPGEIVLEYVAMVEDGADIVVTRPRDDWSYEDFRVFYGEAGRLIERRVTSVSRGSTTHLEFTVDGSEYHALFTSVLAPSVLSELETPEATLSLTTLEPAVLASDVTFECLH